MKKTVCPYCDQPIKGHYCRGCRRYVRNPVETEITYYLNERHPDGDHACEYHEDSGDRLSQSEIEAKKKEIRERRTVKRTAASVPKKKNMGEKIAKKWVIFLLIYMILMFGGTFVRCGVYMIRNAADQVHYGMTEHIPVEPPQPEYEAAE